MCEKAFSKPRMAEVKHMATRSDLLAGGESVSQEDI
jgi:hypothetical protein